MKIGLAAVDMNIVTKEVRRRDVAAFIDEAAAAGCRMVFFPEYVNCQRTAETVADWDAGHENDCFAMHAEPVPDGPCATVVVEKCRQHGIWCGFGINEKRPDGSVINTFALVDPAGRIVDRHIKTHLPTCEEGLTPADELTLLDSPLGRLGVLTCWEIQYPELLRMYQILGADILVFPTAQHEPFALELARVRAYDANRPMLALSYVWSEKPAEQRPLGTAYIDEKGNVLARSENRRVLLVVDVPVKKGCNDIRFALRRPQVYRRIVEQ
jgi:predicted amidohydrolase